MRIINLLAPGSVKLLCLWMMLTASGTGLFAGDDDALDAIVSLVASSPSDEAVRKRAMMWAQDQGRLLDLIDEIAAQGVKQRSQPVLLAAAAIARTDGWIERSVELLESSLEFEDQATTRHQLALMWLAGGWPQQARGASGPHLESEPFADIRLGLRLLEGSDAPTTAREVSTNSIKLVAASSGRWKWATTLLTARGELDAALEMTISGGLKIQATELLNRGALPKPGLPGLRLARLLGMERWGAIITLVDGESESGARWRASMGFEPMLLSNPYRPARLPPLQKALDLLDSADETAARRAVALWRIGGGGQTRQDVGTRLILDELKPDWLGPDRLPESIEQQLRRSTDPREARQAVAAALRAFEGTAVEASLWFQAGRLAPNRDWIERSVRIQPGASVAVEWLPGIEARWKQPFGISRWSRATIIYNPSHFLPDPTLPPPAALVGSSAGTPVRFSGNPPTVPQLHLQRWQLTDHDAASSPPETGIRLRITEDASLVGDDRTLQVTEKIDAVEHVQLELEAIDGQPLIGSDGIPRDSILEALYGISDARDLLRKAPEPPPMADVIRSFAEAAVRRARDPSRLRWIDFRATGDGDWWVDVAGVSGLFATTEATPVANTIGSTRRPSPAAVLAPGPVPTTSLILVGTRRHGLQPSASRPVIESRESPQPLLPAGERLLVTAGVDDRVVVTDSGLVGYFESGASRALWWKQLLKPPLPGVGGFAPLPLATVQPHLPWADAVTPRLIEVIDANGASRFLLLAEGAHLIDAQQIEVLSFDELIGEGLAAATLDASGELLGLDASGSQLIARGAIHPLPRAGGYQLVTTGSATIILGQHRGETWLANFDGKAIHEISPPPLPDERDRPHLRVAALGRWGDEVLLLADRLWLIDETGTSHFALTDAPADGHYRPVHWIQPAPRVTGNRVRIARPWGVVETWRAP
ncbi:MAG: hypothetical protein VX764_10010 [Planctomycetota bacterium]|nr:hypothetical protein [Planctomycetota bacterium]